MDLDLMYSVAIWYGLGCLALTLVLQPWLSRRIKSDAHWVAAVVAGVIGAAGLIMDWLNNKNGADREDAYNDMMAKLHDEWLRTRDNKIKELIGELSKRGIDIYGPQVTTTDTTETETPFITPEYQKSAGLQRAIIEKRLESPTALPAGYEETGISAINKSADKALNDMRNLARQRGQDEDLYTFASPGERERLGSIAGFRANLPLQERQLRNEDLGLAQSMIQAFGRGTTRRGRSVTTAPPDIGDLLNLLLPPGPSAQPSSYNKSSPSHVTIPL